VAIPSFETISQDAARAAYGGDMGFFPKVWPHQVAAFEEFAYDYFYNTRVPPFPNGTGATSHFGQGIWAEDLGFNTSDHRFHDTEGQTTWWESPNKILFPLLQHSQGGFFALMLNYHSIQFKGDALDTMLDCTDERKRTQDLEMDCGVVTSIFSWAPDSFILHPIYPASDLFEFAGAIFGSFSWDKFLFRLFEGQSAVGLALVLESDDVTFTLSVNRGKTTIR
jgi:hypothetical protein